MVHGCQHGLRDPKSGKLMQKAWGWFTTKTSIRQALETKCNHRHDEHVHIEGDRTARTAIYPPVLCRRFAKALLESGQTTFQTLKANMSLFHEQRGCCSEELVFAEDVPSSDVDERVVDQALIPQNPEEDSEYTPSIADDVGIGNPEEDGGDSSGESDVLNKRRILLRRVHQNLGHPSNSTLERMFRDAGAPKEVLQMCKDFQCEACLHKGGKAPARPAIPTPVTTKWQCLSVDTFWWRTPHEGENKKSCVGVSFMDEATDYHTAIIVRQGSGGTQSSISSAEFKKAFMECWLRLLPTPERLRYDEEGCFRNWDVAEFLERLGIALEPIAGEAAWQLGKHSKHLATLKSMMNTLSLDFGDEVPPDHILTLALQAKNEMHAVRGYSPCQWAFGQNHKRVSSFLQQYEHLPTSSAREVDEDFETSLQREIHAKKVFLEHDSRRRIARAMRAQSRTLHEFQTGDLVFYYRKGRSTHKASAGRWMGPARVLCHEKTCERIDLNHSGSIVWLSHNGWIVRCAPEQLRKVTREVQHIADDTHGPQDFHSMFQQIIQKNRYLDLLSELENEEAEDMAEPHQPKLLRAQYKQQERYVFEKEPASHDRDRAGGAEEAEQAAEERRESVEPREAAGRVEEDADRTIVRAPSDPDHSREVQGKDLSRSGPSRSALPQMVERSRKADGTLSSDAHDLRRTHGRDSREKGESKRKREEGQDDGSLGGDRRREFHPSDRREPGGADGVDGESSHHESKDEPSRECPGTGDHHAAGSDTATSRRALRSRSPLRGPRNVEFCADVQSEAASTHLATGVTDVISIALSVTPRDVHQVRRGKQSYWEINSKPKKNAEVSYSKLTEQEKQLFDVAKDKEIDSFLKNEAVKICRMQGIDNDRIMQMRWILTWKQETDKDGNEIGKRPKARLIIKGFQDPDLMTLDRDAPTLSVLFRNLLLSTAASRKFRLSIGDIKTAFLQGDDTEVARQVFADPPADVKLKLGMKEHELFRVLKAIYGLLNAPKRWFEKLSGTLLSQGWVQHQLDKCLFLLFDENSNGGKTLVGMCGIHVDDVLCAGSGQLYEDCIVKLRSTFPFGNWVNAEVVTFCGCEIQQDHEGHIYLGQEKFTESVHEINLTKERKADLEEDITEAERTALRQTLGALNWRATQTAPWLLATTSHLQGCVTKGKVKHLLETNKLVRLSRKIRRVF